MSTDHPRTTGTATSRARLVRPAVRRPTKARLAISGPSGSGKTWTALSIAEVLAPGGRVLVVDTERGDDDQGAAELYADAFSFSVLEWPAPYDPRDLAITLDDLTAMPGVDRPDVVILDSASHFWRGQGGTLDIAGGKFGGWKTATPVQDELVSAILRAGYHVIVCLRARQDYQVEEGDQGKQRVVKLGLAPVQRDDLEYEFQVVITLDMDHRIDVGKTRAQPLAGGSWPAGAQERFALLYREWLDRGIRLARQEDVEALRSVIRTADLGRQWQTDGWPKADRLDLDQVVGAWRWLAGQLGIDAHEYEADESGEVCRRCGAPYRAAWHQTPDTPPDPDPGRPFEEPSIETEEPEARPSDPVEEAVHPETDEPETVDPRDAARAAVVESLSRHPETVS